MSRLLLTDWRHAWRDSRRERETGSRQIGKSHQQEERKGNRERRAAIVDEGDAAAAAAAAVTGAD